MPDTPNTTDKHCIFRSGSNTYCLPAVSVRNVNDCPNLFSVPLTDPLLAGIAHSQQEFLPVYSFAELAHDETETQNGGSRILVMADDSGPWGLKVDEVLALDSVEVTLNPQRGDSASWSAVAVGSATWREEFVTAIDPIGLLRHILLRLESTWSEMQSNAAVESTETVDVA